MQAKPIAKPICWFISEIPFDSHTSFVALYYIYIYIYIYARELIQTWGDIRGIGKELRTTAKTRSSYFKNHVNIFISVIRILQ